MEIIKSILRYLISMHLIKNVIDSSTILIEQNGTNVIYDESEPLFVYADEFMIEEVFTNYLTNALHYCKRSGKVKVWTARSEYKEPYEIPSKGTITGNLRVFVYDEGPTIPVSELDKVFIKFYKVDKARTREYGRKWYRIIHSGSFHAGS